MGKASRQRRLNKEKERQRQRAARGATSRGPGLGYQPGRRQVPSQQDLVNSLIGKAVYALCSGSQEAYRGRVQQLANERAPGWMQAVSRSLVESMRLSVTAAWRHGWQPAELARHVRRELSDTHAEMAADMITDEMRGYAAATVDARWAAQVAALDATPPQAATAGSGAWWGSDAEYLGALQGLAGDGGPRGAVATAIETLHVFQHLEVLERLLSLPGTARPTAQRADPTGAADERLLGKIRALLAKAEATEFAEEAEALSARAQELMAKYSIDHALLAAETGRTEEPGGRRIAVDNPYEAPKASLLQTVAQANRCRVVWSKELGLVTVIGFPADLDAVRAPVHLAARPGEQRDAAGRGEAGCLRAVQDTGVPPVVPCFLRDPHRGAAVRGDRPRGTAGRGGAGRGERWWRRQGPGALPGGTSPSRR